MNYKVREKLTTLPAGIIVLIFAIQSFLLFFLFFQDEELPIFTILIPFVMLVIGIILIVKSRVPVICVYDDKIVWRKTYTKEDIIDPKLITNKKVDYHNKVGYYETLTDTYNTHPEVNLTRPYHDTVKDKPKLFTYYVGDKKVLWFYSNMKNAEKLEKFIDENMQK